MLGYIHPRTLKELIARMLSDLKPQHAMMILTPSFVKNKHYNGLGRKPLNNHWLIIPPKTEGKKTPPKLVVCIPTKSLYALFTYISGSLVGTAT